MGPTEETPDNVDWREAAAVQAQEVTRLRNENQELRDTLTLLTSAAGVKDVVKAPERIRKMRKTLVRWWNDLPGSNEDIETLAQELADEAEKVEPKTGRYRLLRSDPRFNLHKGDILICGRMAAPWASEKVAVLCRESDGYEPGCSQYRNNVQFLSGTRV